MTTQTWCGLMRVYKREGSSTETEMTTPICRIINCDKNKQKKQDPKKRNNRKHSTHRGL